MQNPKTLFACSIFVLLYFLTPNFLSASHVMAEEITYECVSSCQYRIHIRVYRDCAGSSSITLTNLSFQPVSGTSCNTPQIVGSWLANNIVSEVTPICPTVPSNCTSGTISGVQEYYNTVVYDLCNVTCAQRLVWSSCCRNYAITSGAGGNSAYTNQTILDPTLSTCNNSPVFSRLPVFFICQAAPTYVHQGAFDPDGDSLSYELQACLDNQFSPVTYNAGFSPTAPLGPNWTVTLDTMTGMLSFLPTPGSFETGVFCLLVKEWRNGVLIGQTWRDVQVSVMNCNNLNPVLDSAVVVSGGIAYGNSMFGATQGATFCLDLYGSDPNSGQTVEMYWNGGITGGTFVDANNPTQTDTVTGATPVGRFCFTPSTPGLYQFLLTQKDNACPVIGEMNAVISILVGANGLMVSDSFLNCNTVEFLASHSGGNGPYSYFWTGSGGFSGTGAIITHAYPGPGTYPYGILAIDNSGDSTFSGGVITISSTPLASLINPAPDLNCAPDSVWVGAASGYASYQWSTGDTTQGFWLYAPDTVNLTAVDSGGCVFTASDTIAYSPTHIVEGRAYDHDSIPLNQQDVYLIYFNNLDSSLTALDTTQTDTAGYFFFECPPYYDAYYIKAAPDSAFYPTDLPTYFGDAVVFQNASPWISTFPVFAEIYCVQGNNPGGPGFIGGLISQGANKQADPVAGLNIVLMNSTGEPVDMINSNADGYFSFTGLANGTYQVWVDWPFIDNSLAPEIELVTGSNQKDSLAFVLHDTWLELLQLNSREAYFQAPEISVLPNPFQDFVTLKLVLSAADEVKFWLQDAQGRVLVDVDLGRQAAGEFSYRTEAWRGLPSGIYFLRMQVGEQTVVQKMIKQ